MFEALALLAFIAVAGVVVLALVAAGFLFKILFKLVLLPIKLVGGLVLGVLGVVLAVPLLLLALPLLVVALPIVLVGGLLCMGLFLVCGVLWLGCHAFAWIV